MTRLNDKRPNGAWIAAAATLIVIGLSGCGASTDEQTTTPENAAVAPAANATQDAANAAGAAHDDRDREAGQHNMGPGGDQANHQMMEEHDRMRMDHMRMEGDHNAQKGAPHPAGTTTSQATPQATASPEPPPMQGMKHE